MPEKNYGRISIRVPERWKAEFRARKIQIAPLVRSFLYRTLQTSDKVVEKRTEDKSKLRAAACYNQLSEFFVRTTSAPFHEKIVSARFKTPVFRMEYLGKAQPEELAVLAEFLARDEFAEEVLQDIYHD